MYKCRDCGEYFEEPEIYYEKHEFWGAPCTEEIQCCPYCESNDFDESWKVEEEEQEKEDE